MMAVSPTRDDVLLLSNDSLLLFGEPKSNPPINPKIVSKNEGFDFIAWGSSIYAGWKNGSVLEIDPLTGDNNGIWEFNSSITAFAATANNLIGITFENGSLAIFEDGNLHSFNLNLTDYQF